MGNFKTIPARYIRKQRPKVSTVALMDKDTGRMMGRVAVKGKGDSTGVNRVQQDIDIDKDGEPDYFKGQILGRTETIVRASARSKGFVRQI
jgi:hypothetical protein